MTTAGRGPASFLRESGRLFPMRPGIERLSKADGPPQGGGAASYPIESLRKPKAEEGGIHPFWLSACLLEVGPHPRAGLSTTTPLVIGTF